MAGENNFERMKEALSYENFKFFLDNFSKHYSFHEHFQFITDVSKLTEGDMKNPKVMDNLKRKYFPDDSDSNSRLPDDVTPLSDIDDRIYQEIRTCEDCERFFNMLTVAAEQSSDFLIKQINNSEYKLYDGYVANNDQVSHIDTSKPEGKKFKRVCRGAQIECANCILDDKENKENKQAADECLEEIKAIVINTEKGRKKEIEEIKKSAEQNPFCLKRFSKVLLKVCAAAVVVAAGVAIGGPVGVVIGGAGGALLLASAVADFKCPTTPFFNKKSADNTEPTPSASHTVSPR
ncbi:hypothetical protein [Piscirickettsia litoralis]|uniref:Uncharacterized protein n=1 Tax=Piscirickettsia litoralis TaxID=1891921 RepID=A0ABX2ZYY8_9GAMM|nr:hypothetical protein [Piscirickettsia litoralis]ODN41227.1 hypothetical protein BGC07_17590 [Piscirickettsia litoralis]